MSYRQRWIIMPLCFLGPLFIWGKYAFGREDSWHLAFLMSFVFYLGILWIIAAEALLQKLACVLIIVICFFTWKEASIKAGGEADFQPHPVFWAPHTFKSRWNREYLMASLGNEAEKELTPLQLDPEILKIIGTNSVDVYPWETLITAANKLHWTPRPIYQSYIAYTPFLDRKNLEFYASAKAPEFIIWHYHSYQDIDNRYAFSSDPLTLQGILQHYRFVQCKGLFCLWQHTQNNQLAITPPSTTTESSWNTWIDIPSLPDANIIRAHLNTRHTLLGKLNIALWKEGGIEIDYRLKNGEIKTHTLILDNASSGLWASPYRGDGISTNKPEPIDKQRLKQLLTALSTKPAEGYIEKAESIAHSIHIVGWGLLPFKASKTQQLSLILTNDTHSYLVKTQNRSRVGITEHFGKTGIVDLDSCGIVEDIDSKNIAPGNYQLGFVVENEGETRGHLQMPPLMIKVAPNTSENTHNVAAIRIRTTRPWAFAKPIALYWSSMTFTEETPW